MTVMMLMKTLLKCKAMRNTSLGELKSREGLKWWMLSLHQNIFWAPPGDWSEIVACLVLLLAFIYVSDMTFVKYAAVIKYKLGPLWIVLRFFLWLLMFVWRCRGKEDWIQWADSPLLLQRDVAQLISLLLITCGIILKIDTYFPSTKSN